MSRGNIGWWRLRNESWRNSMTLYSLAQRQKWNVCLSLSLLTSEETMKRKQKCQRPVAVYYTHGRVMSPFLSWEKQAISFSVLLSLQKPVVRWNAEVTLKLCIAGYQLGWLAAAGGNGASSAKKQLSAKASRRRRNTNGGGRLGESSGGWLASAAAAAMAAGRSTSLCWLAEAVSAHVVADSVCGWNSQWRQWLAPKAGLGWPGMAAACGTSQWTYNVAQLIQWRRRKPKQL